MKKMNLTDYTATRFTVLSENEYEQVMKNTVETYLDKLRNTVKLKVETTDRIHSEYYLITGSKTKGTVMISHGFTESTQKYHEMIYYFLTAGYNVCLLDHKNHGLSRPDNAGDIAAQATDIDDFQIYVDHLDYVIRHVLKRYLPEPYYLFCHSMGGAIGATYLEQHPDVFRKAILSSPMMGINLHGAPAVAVSALANAKCMTGQGKHFLNEQSTFSPEPDFEGSASTCEPRYYYYQRKQVQNPYLQNSGCSFRWIRESLKATKTLLSKSNCAKIKIPVLLFQAELDTFVTPEAQDQFISQISDGTLVYVPGSKHEVYLSDSNTLSAYLGAILDFLS